LGVILYFLLTGKPPFKGKVGDVLSAVQRGDFLPPRNANARVSRTLEAVCLKAMATLVEDRYSTATKLADDIQRWLADEPVSAFRELAPSRIERWGRRHKPIVASVATLLITFLVALAIGLVVLGREVRKKEEANRTGLAPPGRDDAPPVRLRGLPQRPRQPRDQGPLGADIAAFARWILERTKSQGITPSAEVRPASR
jgi:hypothetical protein